MQLQDRPKEFYVTKFLITEYMEEFIKKYKLGNNCTDKKLLYIEGKINNKLREFYNERKIPLELKVYIIRNHNKEVKVYFKRLSRVKTMPLPLMEIT